MGLKVVLTSGRRRKGKIMYIALAIVTRIDRLRLGKAFCNQDFTTFPQVGILSIGLFLCRQVGTDTGIFSVSKSEIASKEQLILNDLCDNRVKISFLKSCSQILLIRLGSILT